MYTKKVCNIFINVSFFLGARFEFSVAEVWLQQRRLHQGIVSEAEGDVWARPNSWDGFCKRGVASSWNFQAQQLAGGEDEWVWAAREGSRWNKEARPRAHWDFGAAGWCCFIAEFCCVQWENQDDQLSSFPQVIIYAEDFKSERADRERAQGQVEDLKEQVHQLKRQLHSKQVRLNKQSQSVQFALTCFYAFHFGPCSPNSYCTCLSSAGSRQGE